MKLMFATILVGFCCTFAVGQSREEKDELAIKDLMQQFASAALKSDTSVAEKQYADDLFMTSQSGKLYTKTQALQDLKNSFRSYQNDDLKFLHLDKNTVVVNYQNTRKRETLDEAKFRVTAVWVKRKGEWKIVSVQSSRIVAQGM